MPIVDRDDRTCDLLELSQDIVIDEWHFSEDVDIMTVLTGEFLEKDVLEKQSCYKIEVRFDQDEHIDRKRRLSDYLDHKASIMRIEISNDRSISTHLRSLNSIEIIEKGFENDTFSIRVDTKNGTNLHLTTALKSLFAIDYHIYDRSFIIRSLRDDHGDSGKSTESKQSSFLKASDSYLPSSEKTNSTIEIGCGTSIEEFAQFDQETIASLIDKGSVMVDDYEDLEEIENIPQLHPFESYDDKRIESVISIDVEVPSSSSIEQRALDYDLSFDLSESPNSDTALERFFDWEDDRLNPVASIPIPEFYEIDFESEGGDLYDDEIFIDEFWETVFEGIIASLPSIASETELREAFYLTSTDGKGFVEEGFVDDVDSPSEIQESQLDIDLYEFFTGIGSYDFEEWMFDFESLDETSIDAEASLPMSYDEWRKSFDEPESSDLSSQFQNASYFVDKAPGPSDFHESAYSPDLDIETFSSQIGPSVSFPIQTIDPHKVMISDAEDHRKESEEQIDEYDDIDIEIYEIEEVVPFLQYSPTVSIASIASPFKPKFPMKSFPSTWTPMDSYVDEHPSEAESEVVEVVDDSDGKGMTIADTTAKRGTKDSESLRAPMHHQSQKTISFAIDAYESYPKRSSSAKQNIPITKWRIGDRLHNCIGWIVEHVIWIAVGIVLLALFAISTIFTMRRIRKKRQNIAPEIIIETVSTETSESDENVVPDLDLPTARTDLDHLLRKDLEEQRETDLRRRDLDSANERRSKSLKPFTLFGMSFPFKTIVVDPSPLVCFQAHSTFIDAFKDIVILILTNRLCKVAPEP